MEILLQNVCASLLDWKLKDISFKAKAGEFISIVGPSGSGKTTLLRIIAGLQETGSGQIFFGEKNVTKLEPEKRNIGLVFQNDSLFSHLNVFENVAFGLKIKKEKNIQEKVLNALKLLHIDWLQKRSIESLSGGERKRVAIARAIAFEPNALLLDEPLNNLDAGLKEKTKLLLKELQTKTKITMILVTHDLDEAFFLSDKIIILNNGKIEQEAKPPTEIFLKPKNKFVKEFTKDYILVSATAKQEKEKTILQAKFSIETQKRKGKAFINLKKTNYRFFED